jgi:hypothetical protein
MASTPDDVTPDEPEPAERAPMTASRWMALLRQSDSLRAIMVDDGVARHALRVYLSMEADAGRLPVGWVSDPRYLVPDGR